MAPTSLIRSPRWMADIVFPSQEGGSSAPEPCGQPGAVADSWHRLSVEDVPDGMLLPQPASCPVPCNVTHGSLARSYPPLFCPDEWTQLGTVTLARWHPHGTVLCCLQPATGTAQPRPSHHAWCS